MANSLIDMYPEDWFMVEALIKAGADVNIKDKDGCSLLHWGVICRDINLVKLLIKYKVDVNITTKSGSTPLMRTSIDGNKKIVELLIKAGANINLCSFDGYTALMAACEGMHLEIVKILIEMGANINAVSIASAIFDNEQFTVLKIASIQYKHFPSATTLAIVQELEKAGAKI